MSAKSEQAWIGLFSGTALGSGLRRMHPTHSLPGSGLLCVDACPGPAYAPAYDSCTNSSYHSGCWSGHPTLVGAVAASLGWLRQRRCGFDERSWAGRHSNPVSRSDGDLGDGRRDTGATPASAALALARYAAFLPSSASSSELAPHPNSSK